MWNEHDRRELAELIKADDRLRAERASEALRRPSVNESEADGLVYRTYENDAPAPAPVPEPRPSDDDELMHALDEFSKATVDKFRALEIANAELRGKVDALLQLFGQKSGNSTTVLKPESEVVDLPRGFWKRDAA
jgi:hypothetical protein